MMTSSARPDIEVCQHTDDFASVVEGEGGDQRTVLASIIGQGDLVGPMSWESAWYRGWHGVPRLAFR